MHTASSTRAECTATRRHQQRMPPPAAQQHQWRRWVRCAPPYAAQQRRCLIPYTLPPYKSAENQIKCVTGFDFFGGTACMQRDAACQACYTCGAFARVATAFNALQCDSRRCAPRLDAMQCDACLQGASDGSSPPTPWMLLDALGAAPAAGRQACRAGAPKGSATDPVLQTNSRVQQGMASCCCGIVASGKRWGLLISLPRIPMLTSPCLRACL